MVIRGAPAIGVAAAMGIALGMRRSKATGTKQFATEFQKLCDLMAATRPTAVNLFWAIERMKRTFAEAAQGGCSVDEIKQRLETEARRIHDEDVAELPRDGAHSAPTLVPDDGAHPDALQRRRAGDGRLRHGARRDSRRGRAGQEGRGARRRDAAVSAGRAADRVGAGQGRHRHHGHHRQHGGVDDAPRPRRSGRRRRRSDCRQRRRREQDRHLRRRGAGQGARHPVLRRGAALDDRSRTPPTARASRSRSATTARSRTSARRA